MERKIVYLLISVLVFLNYSCATIHEKNQESLKSVVQEYWNLRIQGNFDKSYKFEYKKELPSLEVYKNVAAGILKIGIKNFKLDNIRIENETALIDVEFSFSLPGIGKPSKDIITDKWIYENGKWWHFPLK